MTSPFLTSFSVTLNLSTTVEQFFSNVKTTEQLGKD
jgi:hypothetical protein